MAETEWGFDDPWPTVGDALEAAAVVAGKARELYGDELSDVLLYGSRARGDHCPESDLDVLLVKKSRDSMHWRDPIYKKLTDFVLFDLAAERSEWWLVSLYASSVEQVQTWDTTFYRDIRADAIRVS